MVIKKSRVLGVTCYRLQQQIFITTCLQFLLALGASLKRWVCFSVFICIFTKLSRSLVTLLRFVRWSMDKKDGTVVEACKLIVSLLFKLIGPLYTTHVKRSVFSDLCKGLCYLHNFAAATYWILVRLKFNFDCSPWFYFPSLRSDTCSWWICAPKWSFL